MAIKAIVECETGETFSSKLVEPVLRSRETAVRFGMQGFGSVELDVRWLDLWIAPDMADAQSWDAWCWRTLDEVLRHPLVRGVNFDA
jgi:hypothetical protein